MGTPKKVAVKTVRAAVAAPAAKAPARVSVEINKAARITHGQYEGAVGSVQAISENGDAAQVLVQGIYKGEKLDLLGWFSADWLEAV